MSSDYCPSRHRTVRRLTRVVNVGDVAVGGTNPIRLQSMTTSDTEDIAATLAQAIRLAEAGCEIIRITAPNKAAAIALIAATEGFAIWAIGAMLLGAAKYLSEQRNFDGTVYLVFQPAEEGGAGARRDRGAGRPRPRAAA